VESKEDAAAGCEDIEVENAELKADVDDTIIISREKAITVSRPALAFSLNNRCI
jgi:hypothetical protein